MPSKKKKYNARFPAGRIKKIMQSDEEVGKVAQAVPIIISRTLELFVDSLLNKTLRITNSRNAKTLSPSHMKQCIMSESRFDFLRELVKNVPDINVAEEQQSGEPDADTPLDLCQYSVSLSPPPTLLPTNFVVSRPDDEPIATTSSGVGQSSRSTASSSNGFSSSVGVFRNGGNKRSYNTSSPAPNSLLMQKQHSLDLTQLAVSTTSSQRLNYYTETADVTSSVIQFSSSNQHVMQSETHSDHRPSKLARIDSAPAILSTNNTVTAAVTIGRSGSTSTPAVYSSNLPITTSTSTSNIGLHQSTPVINFDFSKGIPSGTVLYPSSSSTSKSSLAPLTIAQGISTASPPLVPLKLHYQPDAVSTPPAYVNIDVSKSPLVKIDYSKMDLSAPNSPTLPYTSSKSTRRRLSSTNTGRRTTKKPQTPIINIDLSNSFNLNVAPQMFKFSDAATSSTNTTAATTTTTTTTTNSSSVNSNLTRVMMPSMNPTSLDMDEDYDNI